MVFEQLFTFYLIFNRTTQTQVFKLKPKPKLYLHKLERSKWFLSSSTKGYIQWFELPLPRSRRFVHDVTMCRTFLLYLQKNSFCKTAQIKLFIDASIIQITQVLTVKRNKTQNCISIFDYINNKISVNSMYFENV